jgi:hypothetical protein
MFSIKMVTFCKSGDCPASQNLLKFQNNELSSKESRIIREHLAKCEFCATEVVFYSRYPQAEESTAATEIPLPLYELAQALLSNKHKDFRLLNKLLSENDELLLEKA